MSADRRYDETEVAEIFERATRVDQEHPTLGPDSGESGAPTPGMTLAELKRIGAEVGISPDAIESSARAVALGSQPPEVHRRLLGLPIGVAGTALLPRRLSDEEWVRLVALMRDEFGAHGKLEETRTLRSWRNGNLRIQLEPTTDGQRLRMQTYRQSSRASFTAGSALLGTGIAFGVIAGFVGEAQAALGLLGGLGASGMVLMGSTVIGLRGWAARRRAQMSKIAEAATAMSSRLLPGGTSDGSE